MKILKSQCNIEVLSYTHEYVKAIINAARTCYDSFDKSNTISDEKLVRTLIASGHEAMLEMADMTIRFKNISRGFTHQIVRHRLASFAQKSTRYIDESNLHVVVPPHVDENKDIICLNEQPHIEFPDYPLDINLEKWLETNETVYSQLIQNGWKLEDARQVLPIGTKTEIVVKANMREWRKIFELRTAKGAHWEIRKAILKVLEFTKNHMPILVEDFKIMDDYAIKYESIHKLIKMIRNHALAKDKKLRDVIMELGNTAHIWDDDWK